MDHSNSALKQETIQLGTALVSLSKKMLTEASKGEWSGLARLDARRQRVVKQLSLLQIEYLDEASAKKLERIILDVNELNDELESLAETSKASLVRDKKEHKLGENMKRAYKGFE